MTFLGCRPVYHGFDAHFFASFKLLSTSLHTLQSMPRVFLVFAEILTLTRRNYLVFFISFVFSIFNEYASFVRSILLDRKSPTQRTCGLNQFLKCAELIFLVNFIRRINPSLRRITINWVNKAIIPSVCLYQFLLKK